MAAAEGGKATGPTQVVDPAVWGLLDPWKPVAPQGFARGYHLAKLEGGYEVNCRAGEGKVTEPYLDDPDGNVWPLLRYRAEHWTRNPSDTRWVPQVQHALWERLRRDGETPSPWAAALALVLHVWGAEPVPIPYLEQAQLQEGSIVRIAARRRTPAEPEGFPGLIGYVERVQAGRLEFAAPKAVQKAVLEFVREQLERDGPAFVCKLLDGSEHGIGARVQVLLTPVEMAKRWLGANPSLESLGLPRLEVVYPDGAEGLEANR